MIYFYLPTQKISHKSLKFVLMADYKIEMYFIYAKTSLIRDKASVSNSSLAAYEKRMQFGFPKASPVTVATLASDNKYIEKSSALLINVPRKVFPKNDETSGKT